MQQVAGAAGVALFVALMTAQQAKLAASGAVPLEALAGGIRAAFLAGAIGALLRRGLRVLRAQARRAGDARRSLTYIRRTPYAARGSIACSRRGASVRAPARRRAPRRRRVPRRLPDSAVARHAERRRARHLLRHSHVPHVGVLPDRRASSRACSSSGAASRRSSRTGPSASPCRLVLFSSSSSVADARPRLRAGRSAARRRLPDVARAGSATAAGRAAPAPQAAASAASTSGISWFLYYLLIFYALTLALRWLVHRRRSARRARGCAATASSRS